MRYKNGLRLLSLEKLGKGFCAAGETCAFAAVGASCLLKVRPGEIIELSAQGLESCFYTKTRLALCAMEYICFARPENDLKGENVHTLRRVNRQAAG